jgi:hypothetical protein
MHRRNRREREREMSQDDGTYLLPQSSQETFIRFTTFCNGMLWTTAISTERRLRHITHWDLRMDGCDQQPSQMFMMHPVAGQVARSGRSGTLRQMQHWMSEARLERAISRRSKAVVKK